MSALVYQASSLNLSPKTKLRIAAALCVLLMLTLPLLGRYLVSYSQGIDLYRRAMHEVEAKNYDAALALLNAASRKNLGATAMSFVYGNRGWIYANKGLDDQAIRDFSESIRLNAEPAYVFWDRALAYHRKGEFEKALSDYGEAISRDPNLADAYHNRGQILADRGDWARAIAEYSEAIHCDPRNDQFFVDRGMAFAGNNELDNAITNFDMALKLNRTHAGAYIQRAAAYGRKGDWTKGLVEVSSAIQQLPDAPQLRYARAMIYLDRGTVEEAIADCNEALRIAPDYDLGFLTRARAQTLDRNWDEVLRDAASALELNPDLALAHYLRGRAFTAKREFDQAISEFNEALRINPAFQWAIFWRAENYSYRREYSRALGDLRQALEQFPRSVTTHLGLAWFLATCPDPTYRNGAEAVAESLQTCEKSYWGDWAAVDVLSAAYAEHGDFDRAIEFANLALSLPGLSPKDRVLVEERLSLYQDRIAIRDMGPTKGGRNLIDQGVSAYAQGDYDRALRCFNAVLPPNPGDSLSAVLFPFLYGPKEARKEVPWAVPESPALINGFFYRGLAYQKKHQLDEAIADFTTVLQQEPQATEARRERGATYTTKGETDRALRDLDQVIQSKPNDPLAYVLKADALLGTKQWDAAIDAAATAIRLDARLALAYHVRGCAYMGKRESEKAAADFGEMERLDPNRAQNFHDRAELFSAKDDYKSALRELHEMVRRFPRSAYARNALAWFLATCPDGSYRNGPEAVEHAQSACKLSEWMDASHIDTLAAAYAEAGDFDQAVKYATQATVLSVPSDPNGKQFKEHLAFFQRREPYHIRPSEQN